MHSNNPIFIPYTLAKVEFIYKKLGQREAPLCFYFGDCTLFFKLVMGQSKLLFFSVLFALTSFEGNYFSSEFFELL
jgi:hypothetical protein